MLKGLVFCEGPNLGPSRKKQTWSFQQCLALPNWDVMSMDDVTHDRSSSCVPHKTEA